MECIIEARGARKAGVWSAVDTVDSLETATNVARSWYAKGYVVRITIRHV